MKLALLHPVAGLIASLSTKVWIRVSGDVDVPGDADRLQGIQLSGRWHGPLETKYDLAPDLVDLTGTPTVDYVELELEVAAPPHAGEYVLEITAHTDPDGSGAHAASVRIGVSIRPAASARSLLGEGVEPFSYAWGTDRGLPPHRYYLEQFLSAHAADVRGRCLEFQEPRYALRYGGAAIGQLDIIHVDASNPRATIIADLTRNNSIPADRFDCIICTHVLHVIYQVGRAVGELRRILAPGGVLLVAVPHISMCDPRYGELWRFTPEGLRRLLESAFSSGEVTVQSYGNSLVAAGDLRGLVVSEFSASELESYDPWFAVEVCARAVKR